MKPTMSGPDENPDDVDSDPAKGNEDRTDWADEGAPRPVVRPLTPMTLRGAARP